MSTLRVDGRSYTEIRPIKIQYDVYGYSDASVLLSFGNTIVMAAVTLQLGVPHFLKGQRTGWLTAEYAMLPHATHQRSLRESNQSQRNPRSVEISRIISRCLRQVVDYGSIGERTIIVDCDVLQADGSTRVACITAASIALELACDRWIKLKKIDKNIFIDSVAGISLGVIDGVVYTDLSYAEDFQAGADINIVLTKNNTLVEILGSSEKKPIDWKTFDEIKIKSSEGVQEIFAQCALYPLPVEESAFQQEKQKFFSLGKRLGKTS